MRFTYSLFMILFQLSYILCLDKFPWMYFEPYGSNLTLNPLLENSNQTLTSQSINSCLWVLPNGMFLNSENFSNYSSGRYYIHETCNLTIYNIQRDTNGIYHCVLNDNQISKAMLNYNGPPAKDFLDEYKWNLVAGFSTFGGD